MSREQGLARVRLTLLRGITLALALFGLLLLGISTPDTALHAQEKAADGKAKEGSDQYEDTKRDEAAADEFTDENIRTGITKEEAEAIDVAIDTGAKWLLEQQDKDGQFKAYGGGHWVGGQALSLLTLIKCDIPYDHEAIKKGKEWLYTNYRYGWHDRDRIPAQTKTYSHGLILMFLEAYYQDKPKEKDAKDRPAPKTPEEAERERKRQEKEAKKKRKVKYRTVSRDDKIWIKEIQSALEKDQHEGTGMWGYPAYGAYGGPDDKDRHSGKAGIQVYGDFSNTQYAMLGLISAARLGFDPKSHEVYQRNAKFIMDCQEPAGPKVPRSVIIKGAEKVDEDGKRSRTDSVRRYKESDTARGWTYTGYWHHKDDAKKTANEWFTGSMTTATLACLLIAKSELVRLKKVKSGDENDLNMVKSLWDGIAWMTHNFTVETNPRTRNASTEPGSAGNGWHYYYLYGLERAAILAGRDFFGANEWYPLGARLLLKDQREDKSWSGRVARTAAIPDGGKEVQMHDTCFALLFLKRATMPLEEDVPEPEITGRKSEE